MRERRTQEERSAATRTQLLDATIDCLYELGYAGTTTTEIAARAGLSRGAQLHHFPTKQSLVAAAVDHVFERRNREFAERFSGRPPSDDRVGVAIDLLWEMISGPTFYAWLELSVASRTDPELNKSVRTIATRFEEIAGATFQQLFNPDPEQVEDQKVFGTLLFSALEGMSAEKIAIGDHPHIPKVLELIKSLARLALGESKEIV